MKDVNERSCETCAFWGKEDLSVKGYGNVRPCLWMLPRDPDFYSHSTQAPFWAEHLTYQTQSFDGKFCGVWIRKKAPVAHSARAAPS